PVMRAAGRVVDDAAVLQQQFDRLERGAAGGGRPAEDLGEDRVSVAADVEPTAFLLRRSGPSLRPHESGDVIGLVEANQLGGRCPWTLDIGPVREPTHCANQIERGRYARNRQRMAASIRGIAVD